MKNMAILVKGEPSDARWEGDFLLVSYQWKKISKDFNCIIYDSQYATFITIVQGRIARRGH